MLYSNAGEKWYIRLLLNNIPAANFEQLRCFEGIEYANYQEVALARGLVTEQTVGILCYRDAMAISTPHELRALFVRLTLEGFPTMPIFVNERYREAMYLDYFERNDHNRIKSEDDLLRDIANRLGYNNKSMSDYGFPEPAANNTELDREKLKYDPTQQYNLYRQLLIATPPTPDEQQPFIDEIVNAIDNNQSGMYLIQGEGGSGKSTMAKIIAAYARSKKHIVLGCASTALAASVH